MLNQGQCFVRALDKNGKWGTVDVLNLDEDSFRRFILSILGDMGAVTYLVDDKKDEPLKEKKD